MGQERQIQLLVLSSVHYVKYKLNIKLDYWLYTSMIILVLGVVTVINKFYL